MQDEFSTDVMSRCLRRQQISLPGSLVFKTISRSCNGSKRSGKISRADLIFIPAGGPGWGAWERAAGGRRHVACGTLPVACCLLPVACCLLPVAGCRLPVAGCRLPVACGMRHAACGKRVNDVGTSVTNVTAGRTVISIAVLATVLFVRKEAILTCDVAF